MAYAYVGSGAYNNGGGPGVGTVTYSPTVGNTLLVAALLNGTESGFTLSDGHNTYSYLGQVEIGGTDYLALWSASVTTGGSLTIGFGGANGIYGIYVAEYSGLLALI